MAPGTRAKPVDAYRVPPDGHAPAGAAMSFATGLDCFLRGARIAWAKPLRPFVWVPMVVSFALVAVLLATMFAVVQDAVTAAVAFLPDWLDWLAKALGPVLYVLSVLVAGWLFGLLCALAAGPFLGWLSARTEAFVFGAPPPVAGENVAREIVSAIIREGRKLAYHLPRLLAVFLLTLVPVVTAVAPVLWFVFGAWTLAVQFVDYAAENRGLDFRATIALLRSNRFAALGFGSLATVLLAVPFGALFVIPAGVCGGALLWRRCAGAAER